MHTLRVQLCLIESDLKELEEVSRHIRAEILDLDVHDVEFKRAEAPDAAKGEGVTIGSLVVTLANSAVLVSIIQVIRSWLARDEGRQAKLSDGERTLELTGVTSDQQQLIIQAMLTAMEQADQSSVPKD